jgi:hypothetical protein
MCTAVRAHRGCPRLSSPGIAGPLLVRIGAAPHDTSQFFFSMLQIDIWEDRKIFDTQAQSLKDDFFRRLKDIRNKLVSELIYFYL